MKEKGEHLDITQADQFQGSVYMEVKTLETEFP